LCCCSSSAANEDTADKSVCLHSSTNALSPAVFTTSTISDNPTFLDLCLGFNELDDSMSSEIPFTPPPQFKSLGTAGAEVPVRTVAEIPTNVFTSSCSGLPNAQNVADVALEIPFTPPPRFKSLGTAGEEIPVITMAEIPTTVFTSSCSGLPNARNVALPTDSVCADIEGNNCYSESATVLGTVLARARANTVLDDCCPSLAKTDNIELTDKHVDDHLSTHADGSSLSPPNLMPFYEVSEVATDDLGGLFPVNIDDDPPFIGFEFDSVLDDLSDLSVKDVTELADSPHKTDDVPHHTVKSCSSATTDGKSRRGKVHSPWKSCHVFGKDSKLQRSVRIRCKRKRCTTAVDKSPSSSQKFESVVDDDIVLNHASFQVVDKDIAFNHASPQRLQGIVLSSDTGISPTTQRQLPRMVPSLKAGTQRRRRLIESENCRVPSETVGHVLCNACQQPVVQFRQNGRRKRKSLMETFADVC